MRMLITGGAGFIGSHLVKYCSKKQEEITVVDNLTTGSLENLPQSDITFWQGDIRSKDIQSRIIAGHFDTIVHLAAQTTVGGSLQDVRFDAEENIIGTINILEAARQSGVKRVIFSSTAAAYGDVPLMNLPIVEKQPLQPTSFYGLSKVTVEHYLQLYAKLFGVNYVVCRFANVYGERQGDKGEGGVISIFSRMIAQHKTLTIFGNGKQTRDFVYVGDIARGLYAALKTSNVNDVYNLSTQTEISINELVNLFSQVSGKTIQPVYQPVREGDIFRSSLANVKAAEKLQWQPMTSLVEGLERTYDYFVRH